MQDYSYIQCSHGYVMQYHSFKLYFQRHRMQETDVQGTGMKEPSPPDRPKGKWRRGNSKFLS